MNNFGDGIEYPQLHADGREHPHQRGDGMVDPQPPADGRLHPRHENFTATTAAHTRASATASRIRVHGDDPRSGGIQDPQRHADGITFPHSWVFFDWSGGPVHALHDDSDDIVVYGGLTNLLDSLAGPTAIRCEAPFESFDVDRRREIVERCAREGHDFRVINPRATAKRRKALGYEDKTDEIDVQVIRHMATDGKTHFTPVVPADPYRTTLREAANQKLMLMRRTKVPRESTRARSGWAFDSAKDAYADELIEFLPPTDTLSPEQDLALCSGTTKRVYSKCVVAAVGVAAETAATTREFDFLAGLYQNGYPSQIRSDLMMHRWGKSVRGNLPFTDYRRELRWLYHQLRARHEAVRASA